MHEIDMFTKRKRARENIKWGEGVTERAKEFTIEAFKFREN